MLENAIRWALCVRFIKKEKTVCKRSSTVNTHESNVLLIFLLFLCFADYLRVDVMQPKSHHVSGVFTIGEWKDHQMTFSEFP